MKTDEELIQKGDEIIDSLDSFNQAEKYRVLKSLLISLKEIIEKEGGQIEFEGVKQ